jgi:hypothetical protein
MKIISKLNRSINLENLGDIVNNNTTRLTTFWWILKGDTLTLKLVVKV